MKKILVIAPSSYPVLGAEAIVNIKLLKTLTAENDFQVDLISKKSKWSNYPSGDISAYNVKLRSLHIIESDNIISFKTVIQHLLSLFKFGAVFKGSNWAIEALDTAIKLCGREDYDYILTKNAASFLIGAYLKKKYGKKWIATWNDPFPTDLYPLPYGGGLKNRNSLLNRLAINKMREADIHIFPNPRLRNYMLEYLNIDSSSTIIIPHVMHDVSLLDNKEISKDVLKIIHSGNISYPRSPRTFLLALKRFVDTISNKVEFTILGVTDDNLQKIIEENKLEKNIKFLSSVSYEKSLEILYDYHVALIIEADCEEGIYLPTKVADFMQQKKHIFSISPQIGVLNDLYKNGKISYYSNVKSVDDIFKELKHIYADFQAGKLNGNSKLYDESFSESSVLEKYLSF